MIKLSHVSKTYELDSGIFSALDDISLTIDKSEFLSIIGQSGSGKSTLMHIIGLLDKPTSGEIVVNERNINTLNDEELSQLRNEFVGFIFQQFNLINKMTVLENVLLPSTYTKKKLSFDPKTRAMELLSRFGIKEKANSRPNRISGGQQQRTAIARALIMQPELILADEPTGNLDSKTGEEILTLLTELNKTDHVTVIIVTHDSTIAKRTKKLITIHDGKLI